MPVTSFHRTGGDFSATGTGNGNPGRLLVGDIANAHVHEVDLADLSGVTITYHWWAGTTDLGTTGGASLDITDLMAGQDVQVVISFTHQNRNGTGNVTGTEHEIGVLDFGKVNSPPTASANGLLEISALAGHNVAAGTLTLHDPDVGDNPHVKGISDSMAAVSSTFNGQFGQLHITKNGVFHYTADLANPTLSALGSADFAMEHIHYTLTDGMKPVQGEFVIRIDGAHVSSTAMSLADDSASIHDLPSYYTFSSTHLMGNVLGNDSGGGSLHVTDINFGNVTHTIDGGSGMTTVGGAYGTLVMHGDGHYTFNMNTAAVNALTADFHTSLDFSINVSNGHSQGLEHLTIQIDGANDPIVNVGATLSGSVGSLTAEHGVYTFTTGWLGSPGGFIDPEGSALHFALSGVQVSESGVQSGAYKYLTHTNAYGTFWLWNTGEWSFTLDAGGAAYQALGACDGTTLDFKVGISDGAGDSSLQDVIVHINGVNDSPVVVSDSILVPPTVGGAYHVTGNLLSNDHDPDRNDHLSVVGVWATSSSSIAGSAASTHGNVLTSSSSSPVSVLHNNFGTLTVWGDGHYTLDVNPNDPDYIAIPAGHTVPLYFSYQVSDGHSDPVIGDLTITVVGIDEPPVAQDATVCFTEDQASHTAIGNLSFTDPQASATLHIAGIAAPTPSGCSYSWDTTPVLTGDLAFYTVTDAYGQLRVNATDKEFIFTLDTSSTAVQSLAAGETHVEQFEYKVSDGNGGTDIASINVVIHGVNDAPTAPTIQLTGHDSGTISGTFYCGAIITADLACAAIDVDHGDSVSVLGIADTTDGTFAVSVSTSLGTATLDGSGILHFHIDQGAVDHLAAGSTDQVTIAYKVADLSGSTDISTVTITIVGGNDAPTAHADAVNILAGAPSAAHGQLAFSDVDNHDSVQLVSVDGAHVTGSGALELNTAYGQLHLWSNGAYAFALDNASTAVHGLAAGEVHHEVFTYHVADLGGLTATATIDVAITGINDAPVATAHFAAAMESGVGTAGADATANLLAGASDIDGDKMHVVGLLHGTSYLPTITLPYGKASVTADGCFDFHLDQSAANHLPAGSTPNVTIDFKISDGHGGTDINSIQVTIHGANDAPTAACVTTSMTEDTPTVAGNLLAGAHDPDDTDQPMLAFVDGFAPGAHVTGAHGWLSFTQWGDYTYHLDVSAVQSLTAQQTTLDNFTFTISDGHGGTGIAHLQITIDGQNDNPIAGMDTASITAVANTTTASTVTGNVLCNDSVSGASQTLMAVSLDGIAITADSLTVTGSYGHLYLASDGDYTYSLDNANHAVEALASGDVLHETFHYKASDGAGHWATADLTITINGVNDAPVAGDDTGSAAEAGSSSPGHDATGNVLGNDSDVDRGSVILVSDVDGSAGGVGASVIGNYGTLVLNADGSYHYIVDDSLAAVNEMGPGDSLHDVFSYTVTDGLGGTSSAQLDITIAGANDAPTGGVSISGTAAAGDTLAAISNLVDPEGLGTLHYQWQSDGVDITDATGSTFTVTQAQMGTVIGVVVSYVDGKGSHESVTATISAVAGQYILGTRANESLVGGAGNDTIDGGSGHDTMIGGGGSDLYYVNDARDVVIENPNAGHDTVIASVNYVLAANVEDLVLTGSATVGKGNGLDNVIEGDSRNNSITGFAGADTLSGGAGQDTFVYTSTSDSSPTAFDTILDFNAAEKDKIDLRQIDARTNVPQNQSFRFIGTAEFDPHANNSGLLRFDPVTHMLEGSTNADANPEFCILLVGVDHIGKDAGGISAANILL